MDTEVDPKLEQNDLERLLKSGRDKAEGYTGLLIAAVIAVVVLIGGWLVMRTNAASQRQAAWQKLSEAEVAESYAAVVDEFPGSEAAVWARISEAKDLLGDGLKLMYTDRDTGRAKLEQAREAANEVLDSSAADFQAQEQAAMILAGVTETLSDGDMQPAVDAYQSFAETYPNSGMVAFARAKVEELSRPEVSEFYAWFSKQNPKPDAPAAPRDGLGESHFDPPPADMPAAEAEAEADPAGDGEAAEEPAETAAEDEADDS